MCRRLVHILGSEDVKTATYGVDYPIRPPPISYIPKVFKEHYTVLSRNRTPLKLPP